MAVFWSLRSGCVLHMMAGHVDQCAAVLKLNTPHHQPPLHRQRKLTYSWGMLCSVHMHTDSRHATRSLLHMCACTYTHRETWACTQIQAYTHKNTHIQKCTHTYACAHVWYTQTQTFSQCVCVYEHMCETVDLCQNVNDNKFHNWVRTSWIISKNRLHF